MENSVETSRNQPMKDMVKKQGGYPDNALDFKQEKDVQMERTR